MIEQIGPYRVVSRIAATNTAEIFAARPAVASRAALAETNEAGEVALKVLRPEFAQSRTEQRYLRTEARICSELDHPAMIGVLGVQLDAPRPYLVMERFLGHSLRQRLDANQLSGPNAVPPERRANGNGSAWASKGISPREAVPYLSRLADGLAHMHDHGWVHCDVKPQNILIGEDDEVRLIDMALARHMGKRGMWRRFWGRMRRRTEGTRSYMSPEQIRAHRVDGRSDVYALGVTLFEVLAGRLPYAANNSSQLLSLHLSAHVPLVSKYNEQVSPELDDLVRSMMAKQPEDRPQAMAYVSSRLADLGGSAAGR
ncbi:MAG: serine/threonine-protein kinase [Phycisphaerae bacterium]|nr:serine/threonine-protein kinase [Phycisphaerae bacterium]